MDGKLYGLDLFSGIGGITKALEQYVKPVAYCENDRYAQSVLLSRMQSGALPNAPIWDDVTTLSASHLGTPEIGIDIIYGGFPCQDISVAGHGKGLEGERSGLFYEIIRLTKEIRPPFVFLENVPAIRTRGLREVIRAFTDLRYDCRWTVVSAAEVGAPHIRKRWFLLAHSNSERVRDEQQWQSGGLSDRVCDEGKDESQLDGSQESVADIDIFDGDDRGYGTSEICEQQPQEKAVQERESRHDRWTTEPSILRVAHGLPHRLDRIKCLGNAVVPKQAEEAFKKLMGLK